MNNGFKKGHKQHPGIEKGWFKKKQSPWNKGKKFPRKDTHCIICKKNQISTGSYCLSCSAGIQRKWREKNRERSRSSALEYHRRIKREVLEHYGGIPPRCACCDEKEYAFLSLDHMNGDGARHRKELNLYGLAIYRWVKRNNFPKDFQVLCFNCNLAKQHVGKCPHLL
jgi:hypothetical protein